MSPSRRRGYSLLELILGSVIMMMVGGFGLYSLSQGRDSAQSKGLAEELAEELKAARQQAVSKQQPVAVAFPGGAGGKSQSFYLLEGHALPKVVRSVSYAETYPDSCYYWGSWGTSTVESTAETESPTDFEVDQWTPLPRADDKMIVFTPSGTAVSNGLPLFGSEYRLLVSNGIEGGGGGAPTAVSKPYTIRVSKGGGITLEPGVAGGPGIANRPSLPLGSLNNSIPPITESVGTPRIDKLTCEPKPLEKSEKGALAVIPTKGYLTLTAEAEEPSGEPLTMIWEADGPSGSGKFSSDKPVNMSWDAKRKRWVGRIAWTPPHDAADGEVYSLSCIVKNPQGQHDKQVLAGGASVEIIPDTRMAAVNTDEWWENYNIAWMNPDGTSLFNVTVPEEAWEYLTPVWSPSGTKIAFYAGKDIPATGKFEATLYLVNDDGTNLSARYTCKGDITDYYFGPSFSPDGARMAFTAYENENDYNDSKLYICNTYGTPFKRKLTYSASDETITSSHTDVTWHPVDERYLLYTFTQYDSVTEDYIESGLRICTLPPMGTTGASSKTIVKTRPADEGKWGKMIGESHWARGGKRLVYTQGGKLYLLYFDPSTGNAYKTRPPEPQPDPPVPPKPILEEGRDLTPAGVSEVYLPRFSPGGGEIAFLDENWYLCVVNADNPSEFRRLFTRGSVEGYNWSPDGEHLIATTWVDEEDSDMTLWKISRDGEQIKDVTPESFRAWSTPSWAPGENVAP